MIKLSTAPSPEADSDYSVHRTAIAAAALRRAVMVDRAAAEILHRNGKVSAERAGLLRRRSLDVARSESRWDGFTEYERGLLLSQEGSWAWYEVWPRLLQVEDVRVFRWVLGIDPILAPFVFLSPDLAPAHQLVTKPEMLDGAACLPPWDLRPAKQEAEQMVTRCVAEGVHRGFFTESEDTARRQLLEIAERMNADESADLLVGVDSVGKAGKDRLQWIAQAAIRRMRVLDRITSYLSGGAERESLLVDDGTSPLD